MWSVTLKLMRKNARMLIPAGIAILIGTMFIASTLLFGNTLDHSLRRQISASYGEANYAIVASDDDAPMYGITVGDLNLDQVRRVEGVAGVRADVTLNIDVTAGDLNSSGIVIANATPSTLMPVELAEGDWPADDGQIVLPRDMAVRLKVGIGDTVSVSYSDGAPVELTVSGLSLDPGGAYAYYGGTAVASEATLGRLLASVAAEDVSYESFNCSVLYLDIEPPAGVGADQVIEKVNALLPAHFAALDRAESEDQALERMGGGQTSMMTTFMMVFGVLAMFVAALVIANTFQVLVAQRRRTLALLRTIGAKKGQLYRSVVVEALLLGLISSLIAVGLSIGLMQLLHVSGVEFSGISFVTVLTPQVFLVPIAFGVVVTILASLGSARTATTVTPLEALQPLEISEARKSGTARSVVSVLLMLFGAAVTAFTVVDTWRQAHGESALSNEQFSLVLLMAMAGVMIFFLGLLLCANRWVPLLLKGVGALVAHIGPACTIATANIQKNPRRVAATSTALLIGVALVATLGTGAASARQTLASELDARYSVDIQVSGEGVDQSVLDDIRKVAGIQDAELVGSSNAVWHTDDYDSNLQVYTLTERQGRAVMNGDAIGDLRDGVLLVPDSMAGDTDDYWVRDGATLDLELNATYDDEGEITGGIAFKPTVEAAPFRGVNTPYGIYGLVPPETLDKLGATSDGYEVWAKTDGTVTPADVIDDIQTALSSIPGISVGGSIAERVSWDGMVNMLLMVLVALLAVAVIIALIGVANTLSLSVIERTRESATLRALGMTRGQLRRSLAVEALLISLVSGVVGIVVGTVFGWIGSYIVFSMSFGSVVFPIDWATSGAILAIATVAALLASVFPARRAVRTPPVEALAEA
ncbi:ABC transporter permease [Bifidobacterium pullorum]|uniref:ABC transporter permease n=1 Tax=Bifidobacterium pullorum TaxID=78448 RepID=UPI0005299414|nr:FtsX-like permease family protein [Bifidobacterium pullorum]